MAGDHSRHGHADADRQVDQEGRQPAKRPGHAILEGDVLGRDDFDVRVELPVLLAIQPIICHR